MAENQKAEPNFIDNKDFPPAGNEMATPRRSGHHVSPGRLERIYRSGTVLAITEHVPPEPFRSDFYELSWYRKPAPEEEVLASGQLGWCLKCPQVETQPKEGAQQHSLKILQVISVGYHRRSQVFKCQLDGDEEKIYMAKAYDPAFSVEYPYDVTYAADASYSTEAAAYEDIKRFGYDGTFSPRYYGSWTFNLPIYKDRSIRASVRANTRPVRMILMEYIEGLDFEEIFKVKVELLLSPQERLYVLNDILKAKAFLQFAGVSHRDPFPRNVILRGSSSSATDITGDHTAGKVVIIDFEHAVATRRPNCLYAAPREDRPINPIYHHWRHCPAEWGCLVPEPFFSNYAEWQKWMKDSWLNNRAFTKPLGMEIAPWDRDIRNWFPQFA
ncbi:unnamed protein product [Clonostachys rhizophaga]|uniref:Protein kinase domain-containing protein n=1 Tax=Clonostachys rhizophaga TaxID=160324 RepID=A0A9N9VFQ4_9HYPO|nr:unnamed protein product [Clonostachys rhizophaga]